MAFGFPAYHTEELTGTPDPSFRKILRKAIRTLGWSIHEETDTAIFASSSLNLWSWGEKIEVEFHRDGATVTSRCALVTQCFDWGRNKSNVRKLLIEYRALVEESYRDV